MVHILVAYRCFYADINLLDIYRYSKVIEKKGVKLSKKVTNTESKSSVGDLSNVQ